MRPEPRAVEEMMTRRSWILPMLLPALFALAPAAAGAHEYWLAPSLWSAAAGDTVSFGALAGEGFAGERKRLVPERAIRLVVR